jgi:hypothetical protein
MERKVALYVESRSQEGYFRVICERRGWDVFGAYRGYTKGLNELLQDARGGDFQGVVFPRLHSIRRSDMQRLREVLHRGGIKILYLDKRAVRTIKNELQAEKEAEKALVRLRPRPKNRPLLRAPPDSRHFVKGS